MPDCTTSTLINSASCFLCLDTKQLLAIQASLLCQLQNSISGQADWVVALVKPSGERTFYDGETDAARGTALIAAVAASVAGDAILVGPGTFNVGDVSVAGLVLKSGCSVTGFGSGVTFITGTSDPAGIFMPTSNNVIQGLSISATGHNIFASTALGTLYLRDIRGSGGGDVYTFNGCSGTIIADRCYGAGNAAAGDVWVCGSSGGLTVRLNDCYFTQAGSGASAASLKASTGAVVIARGCVLEGTGTSNKVVWAETTASSISLYGCQIVSTGASNIAIQVDGTGIAVIDPSSTYDFNKTSGALTYISERLAFAGTADAGPNNSTAEVTLFGAGSGVTAIAANTARIGTTYRVKAICLWGDEGAANNTLAIRMKMGGATLTTPSITILDAAPGVVDIQWDFTFRTIGATATLMWVASVTQKGGNTSNNIGSSTVNTTGSLAVDVTADFVSADTLLSRIITIEKLN